MSGRLVHKLEYHYSDGAFGDILRSAIMEKWIDSLNIDSLIFRTLVQYFKSVAKSNSGVAILSIVFVSRLNDVLKRIVLVMYS